ncbi:hypothetical protein MC7420_2862 [Coleofasciculus chthonoplastes PCC 7420]|uniref:Uncharacterized protein n=1 Tax=Coleofasciculus chthonoplastes PCC 7420 TaxID=118168 RepID=B4VK86_9CYAN|nr:hypothetical protein MC7420_2862 [Coleofasciculus chthonoplastes PCC 7420]
MGLPAKKAKGHWSLVIGQRLRILSMAAGLEKYTRCPSCSASQKARY